MNLKSRNKTEHQKLISQVKTQTPLQELCKDIPVEFTKYMSYVRNMGFFDEPNYNYLKKLFRTLFLDQNLQYDDKYDWIKDGMDRGRFQGMLKIIKLIWCVIFGMLDPVKANEKRSMFEKYKSVNP